MIENLVIVHRKQDAKGQVRPLSLPTGPWVLWKTCLRQMALGFHDPGQGPLNFNLSANIRGASAARAARTQVYYGEDAYQFLLEVVCGLHSPMLGETEVAGQFKGVLDGLERPDSSLTQSERILFQRLFNSILTDAKNVRQGYLLELGGRSYGSLLRKHLPLSPVLHFIGAGHLVREIIPWLHKQAREIHIFCRRPFQAQPLLNAFENIQVHRSPAEGPGESFAGFRGVVVVAAPVESAVLQRWFLSSAPHLTQVIDLRDVASSDPLRLSVPVLKLHDLFEELSLVEKDILDRVRGAKALIVELTQRRGRAAENRPFGWEDLCG